MNQICILFCTETIANFPYDKLCSLYGADKSDKFKIEKCWGSNFQLRQHYAGIRHYVAPSDYSKVVVFCGSKNSGCSPC